MEDTLEMKDLKSKAYNILAQIEAHSNEIKKLQSGLQVINKQIFDLVQANKEAPVAKKAKK